MGKCEINVRCTLAALYGSKRRKRDEEKERERRGEKRRGKP